MPYCPECSASVPEGAAKCPTCGSSLVTTPSTADTGADAQPLDIEQLRADVAQSLEPRYQILKLLGTGGMGAVFLAREPALRRLVAVKVLSPYLSAEPKARARFEREARAAAALSHPNVVRVYAVGETGATRLPYIIMQYVEGETLSRWMGKRKRVSERDARRVIGEVAAALAAAHTRDLVHRDVKPSNVLIEAESGRAFVVDFGVSAAVSPDDPGTKLTVTGTVVGTPAYMSPEQAAGEPVSPKSDVYSLGLLGYELLTGALPYSANTAMGWAAAHLRDPATPVGTRRPDVAPEVARTIDRCLVKQAALRPEARDVAQAMMPSLESEVTWPPPGLAWLQGRGRVLARLSLLAAIGGLLTVFALAFTPRILLVHAYWLARFAPVTTPGAGPGLGAFRADPAATAQFVWQTVLVIGLAAFATSLSALISVALQASSFALARRRRGWGWATLVDVAVDPDGRSGLILAGTREFASLDPDSRRAVVAARRLQTAVELAAGPWVALVAALWTCAMVVGLVSNQVTQGLMNTAVWLGAALPVLGCLVASAAARYFERRLTAALIHRPQFEESNADVSAWYASAPADQRPAAAARPPRRLVILGSEALAALLALAVLLTLAAAGLAALVAAVSTGRLGAPASQLTGAIAIVDRQDPLGTARQLVAAILPAQDQAGDSLVKAGLRRLTLPPAGPDALPDYTPGPTTLRAALQGPPPERRLSGPPLRMEPRGGRSREVRLPMALSTSEALRRALARRIPADTVRLLRAVGAHPRTTLFRDLTRATHWDLAEGFTPLGRFGEAALANLLGAIGDLAQGDIAAARRRLGENAAAGFLLLQVPTPGANELGRNILGSFALMPLAELEQLQGNARTAAELREGVQRLLLLGLLTPYWTGGLAADPGNLQPVAGYLRDPRLPAGWRATLMAEVAQGACTNPREILLGLSPTRGDMVLAAAADMTDPPHTTDLARRAMAQWTLMFGAGVGEPLGFLFRIANCLEAT